MLKLIQKLTLGILKKYELVSPRHVYKNCLFSGYGKNVP